MPKTLNKEYVESSNLDWISYDESEHKLYIQFKNQSLYVYYDVPKEIYTNLKNAVSKGKYHAYNIKWKFEYKRLK